MIPLSIHVKKKVKIANYHLGQLFWPVSQIRLQRRQYAWFSRGGSHIFGHNLSINDEPDRLKSASYGPEIVLCTCVLHYA